jgi:hypothetical protein
MELTQDVFIQQVLSLRDLLRLLLQVKNAQTEVTTITSYKSEWLFQISILFPKA